MLPGSASRRGASKSGASLPHICTRQCLTPSRVKISKKSENPCTYSVVMQNCVMCTHHVHASRVMDTGIIGKTTQTRGHGHSLTKAGSPSRRGQSQVQGDRGGLRVSSKPNDRTQVPVDAAATFRAAESVQMAHAVCHDCGLARVLCWGMFTSTPSSNRPIWLVFKAKAVKQ